MTARPGPLPTEEQLAATRHVAEEMRALSALAATRDVPSADLAALGAQLTAARTSFEGFLPRPRWYDVAAHAAGGRELSRAYHDEFGPVRGLANPVAPPLAVAATIRPDGSPAVAGQARLGPAYEGPPRMVHGGWLAALFDEVLGVLQRDLEVGGLTAQLTVRFRRPVPVGAALDFLGWVDDDQGRNVMARATCHIGGELVAEAEARFVRVDVDAVEARLRAEREDTG
jgi:hypothetical protein